MLYDDGNLKTICNTEVSNMKSLILYYNSRRLRILYFLPSQIDEANRLYTHIESYRKVNGIDAVLVRAASFGDLKAAYPNYFADIGDFLSLVSEYLK